MEKKEYSIFISGGTRGIGRAVAEIQSKKIRGKFFLNYLQNKLAATEAKNILTNNGSEVHLIQANLQYDDEIDNLIDYIYKNTDSLNSFVHCAALTNFRNALDLKPHHLEMTMSVNSFSLLKLTQKLSNLFAQNSSIVALSSMGANRVIPFYSAMGPTKAALESLIRYLAVELASRNIRVNGVSAGLIDTDSIRIFPNYKELEEKAINRTPMNRIGKPEEVAEIVSFLLSIESGWITGQTIIADGGYSLY